MTITQAHNIITLLKGSSLPKMDTFLKMGKYTEQDYKLMADIIGNGCLPNKDSVLAHLL